MIFKAIIAVLAALFMAAVCVWIFIQCWKDSRDDFRMVWRELKYTLRRIKKKAD